MSASAKYPGHHESAPQEIEVGIGEWAQGQGKTILETGGLSTCIGLATHDKVRRIGHLAHLWPIGSTSSEELTEVVGSIIGSTRNPGTLRVWLRGSGQAPETEGDDGDSGFQRDHDHQSVIVTLQQAGINPDYIDAQWHQSDEQMTMRLNCQTGTLTTELFDPFASENDYRGNHLDDEPGF